VFHLGSGKDPFVTDLGSGKFSIVTETCMKVCAMFFGSRMLIHVRIHHSRKSKAVPGLMSDP
jgi:hypothetical protein